MDSNKNSLQHHQQQQNNQISSGMLRSPSSAVPAAPAWNFINKDGNGAYDLGELDHALLLYLENNGQEPSIIQQQTQNSELKPHTLDMFPSKTLSSKTNSESANLYEPKSVGGVVASDSNSEPLKVPKCEESQGGSTSGVQNDSAKTLDPKILRRLAQNREAARKSRLRKKAYVQQLESCRMKLAQLEQEIHRAWAQGIYLGGSSILGREQGHPLPGANIISSDAAIFDLEYARWLEEHHRLMTELRGAVEENLPENEMRVYVNNVVTHFDEMINLKSMLAKSDVFHIFSGMWKTPAERCFMWMGGFRPSDLLKISVNHQMEGLTEQQVVGLYGLQRSTQEAEEALSRSLEYLNQSLSESLSSDTLISFHSNVADYMALMPAAMAKLSTLQGFLQQADNLRQQTVHRLNEMLSPRQGARSFLAIADYFHRLRSLSSLWLTRPRQD